VTAERASCAPDRRFLLSLYRTSSPRTSKFKIAVSALGLVAAAAGSITVWSADAAAQPAASSQLASTHAAAAARSTAPSHPALAGALDLRPVRQSAELDAFAAMVAAPHRHKQASPARPIGGRKKARKVRLTPKQVARQMLHRFRWTRWQFQFLNLLWSRESSWNVHASNPYSGAYGIPQAVPGAKMASAGPDWAANARTQIRWGLRYIKSRYGSPYAAWEHELATGWY
jgi:hypothetical protein